MMQYIDVSKLTDLEWDFVRRLRFSKVLDTLDRQCELLEVTHKGNQKILDAVNVAWCVREQELVKQGAPVFKGGKIRMTM
jgi:hypothetical protein